VKLAGLANPSDGVQSAPPLDHTPEPETPPTRSGRELLAIRTFYFFAFAGLGSLFPFLPLLLESRGLCPQSISHVLVVSPIVNVFVPPLWGLLADALAARVRMLRIACAGSGLATMALVPARGVAASMAALLLLSVFRAPVASLADSVVWTPKQAYSLMRVWGSVGFAAGAVLVGKLQSRWGTDVVVYSTSASYLVAGACAFGFRGRGTRRSEPILRHVGAVLARPAVLLLLTASAAYYVAHGSYDAFFSVHLRRIGFGDDFVGVAWGTGVAVEIGVMLLSPRVFRRWPASVLLGVCSVVAIVRWLLLAYVRSVPALLGAQALHGVTFGLWYLALVDRVQRGVPDHLRTSVQAVTAAALALGMVVGYLTGGVTVTPQGASTTFLIAAGASTVALVLYLSQARRRSIYA